MPRKKPPSHKTTVLSTSQEKSFDRFSLYWGTGIAIITLIVMFPSFYTGFINFDDLQYVTQNSYIRNLNSENLRAILLTDVNGTGNWHPLTMLSLALDYMFSGSNPKGYHLTNILLHILNTLLVFRFTFMVCKRLKIKEYLLLSVTASLLFGVHPMHVESVAWVSGRKDLLYTCFYLVSLLFYLEYTVKPKRYYYFLSMLFFILSLLSKAMAVTLPVVLILVDHMSDRRQKDRKVILEKIPFFTLAIIFGIVAVFTQKSGGATEIIRNRFFDQVVFASYGFTEYILKLIWPFHLSPYYPYPERIHGAIPLPIYLSLISILILIYLLYYFVRRQKKETPFFRLVVFYSEPPACPSAIL